MIKANENIRVAYVCKCGNTAPQKQYQAGSYMGYFQISKNLEIICGGCGQMMKVKVIKETTEIKTKTI